MLRRTRHGGSPYLSLIKQYDDPLGAQLDYPEKSDPMAESMIVLTSDHGN
ncbi:hypothetical protein [Litoreibacter ponti]|nr:hypothetical protein [Litoreibacter ponti]